MVSPPERDEYAEFYAGYVARAAAADPRVLLVRQVPALRKALSDMSDRDALTRYAPGKWSIKEVVGHLIDAERVFAHRIFRIGRGDATPLAGFDENFYVEAGEFDRRPIAALLEELAAEREATLRLVEGMSAAVWERRGVASGAVVTVRAILYILTGHVEHHLEGLRERYGVPVEETG